MFKLNPKGIYESKGLSQREVAFMTLPFFYNYKEALVKKLKEDYSEAITAKRLEEIEGQQMAEADQMIKQFFKDMENSLADVLEVSHKSIQFDRHDEREIARLTIGKNYVVFTWKDKRSIEVEIGTYVDELDMVEASIVGYIVPSDKKPVVKKVGKVHEGGHFDENTLNYYLRTAFGNILKEEIVGHGGSDH